MAFFNTISVSETRVYKQLNIVKVSLNNCGMMRLPAVSDCLDGSAEIDHKMVALFITLIIFAILIIIAYIVYWCRYHRRFQREAQREDGHELSDM